MKIYQKIIFVTAILFASLLISGLRQPHLLAISCVENCTPTDQTPTSPSSNGTTSTTPVNPNPDCNNPSSTGLQNCLKSNKIVEDLNGIIDFLSAGVAIVVIGSIILGGIQYSMAGGSPDAVSKAKHRITNALLAFVAFLFIFAFLQWIIPGGL